MGRREAESRRFAYVGTMLHQVRRFFISTALVFAASAFACGCGGGGGGSPASFAAPPATPTPSPSPTPGGPLTASRTAATLTLAGQSATVTLSEPGYGGNVLADAGACANIASVSPSLAPAPASFTITALGSGSCAIGFTDLFGQRAGVQVGVTITQGTIK